MTFSKDVTRFYLHDDTKVILINKQSTNLSHALFDNEVCVSTISNYIRESPHAAWKNPTFMCTSEQVPLSGGVLLIQGTLRYVTITRSGHRIKSSKRIIHKAYRPKKKLMHMRRYCDLDSVSDQCRECRMSCGAAIQGVGYLYCKDGWTYMSYPENGVKPEFIPFKEKDLSNVSMNYTASGNDSKDDAPIHDYVIWALAGLIGIIVIIALIIWKFL